MKIVESLKSIVIGAAALGLIAGGGLIATPSLANSLEYNLAMNSIKIGNLEYKVTPEYGKIKKIKITLDYGKDERLNDVSFEKTLRDGTRIIENDYRGPEDMFDEYKADGKIDFRIIYKILPDGTKVEEHDSDADGKLDGKSDWIMIEKILPDGTKLIESKDGSGNLRYKTTERTLPDGTVIVIGERDYNVDGKPECKYVRKTEILPDGIEVERIKHYENGKLDYIFTTRTSPDTITSESDWASIDGIGTIDHREIRSKLILPYGIMKLKDQDADGIIDCIETERTLPDGTKITETDKDGDGITDYKTTRRTIILNF